MHSGTIAKFVRGDYCYEAKRATERTVVFMTSRKGGSYSGIIYRMVHWEESYDRRILSEIRFSDGRDL